MIVLVRHAHTDFNVKGELGRFCGVSDPKISQRGVNEARLTGLYLKNFHFKRVFSSSLNRSVQTANIIKAECNISGQLFINKGLNEIDYGDWDGLTKKEIAEKYPSEFEVFNQTPDTFIPNNGENPSKALERFKSSFHEIPDESIVVTHKTVIRLFICDIMGIDLSKYRQISEINLSSLSLINFGHKISPIEINLTQHLK